MSYLIGKSLYEKCVVVAPSHGKFSFLFIFENHDAANKHYDAFDYEKEKILAKRIKAFFCQHKNEEKLDVGSKFHHYIHCPNCERAIYVDDEPKEDREKRIKKMWRNADKQEIEDLEDHISHLNEKLVKMKEKYETYEEEEMEQ